ncbi:MAG: hypothetical protein ACI97P_001635 [Arcticibacterium sp.]|jgi:hypothetical protein
MEQKPTSAQIALKWGVICALATIILTTAINMSGFWKSSGVSMFAFVPLIAFMVLAMKEYKEGNGEFMTFGEGFGLGMLLAAISGVISSLWGIIFVKVIDPTFTEQMRDFQIENFEEQGLGEEQIEAAIQMTEKFSTVPMMFIFGLIFTLIIGLIISLIVSAIMKKNKPVF